MAYCDENGKIMIDEQVAAKDVRRLQDAVQVLRDSRDAIRSLQRQAAEMKGATIDAIYGKSQEMDKKLSQMIEKLEETISYIQKTVRRYELLDEQLKQAIQSSTSIENAVVAASVSNSSSGSSGGKHSSGGGRKESQTIAKGLSALGSAIGDFLDDIF